MGKPRHIFITSDWHLGGTADQTTAENMQVGTSICRSTKEITAWVDWVKSGAADSAHAGEIETEIVLNGDIVDFLAADDAPGSTPEVWIGDEERAIARLERIVRRAAEEGDNHRGPFEALAEFLAGDGCAVTLLSGNHDVELCLPKVRQYLVDLLGAHGRRYEFIHDGEACVRGRMLIEHGNRYDPLNNVNHSRLRQERAQLSRGLPIDESKRNDEYFLPPLGTQLVVHAFNPLLPACPFLNLIKPERGAALPLLLSLHPDVGRLVRELFRLFPIGWHQWWDKPKGAQPTQAGFYSGAAVNGMMIDDLDAFLDLTLGRADAAKFRRPDQSSLAGGLAPTGGLQAIAARGKRIARSALAQISSLCEAARTGLDDFRLAQCQVALNRVKDHAIFDPYDPNPDPDYAAAAEALLAQGQVDAVVFGHTHLAKDLVLDRGRYLNAGTWAELMRLPATATGDIGSADASNRVLMAFLEDMKAHRIQPYLLRRLTYVEAWLDKDGRIEQLDLRRWGGRDAPRQQVNADVQS